jgi:hypothetical protein
VQIQVRAGFVTNQEGLAPSLIILLPDSSSLAPSRAFFGLIIAAISLAFGLSFCKNHAERESRGFRDAESPSCPFDPSWKRSKLFHLA